MRALHREVFTTGQVATISRCSQQSAIKWCDTGKLPFFRVPGSKFRRVTRDALRAFLEAHGMDISRLSMFDETGAPDDPPAPVLSGCDEAA